MSITYPPAAPTITGDIVSISRFLASPAQIARRLRTLAQQRFISDALLTGRFVVVGGAIQYEQGESIYADRVPQTISPGGEYPLTTLGTGPASLARTEKWGQDSIITDESIKRQLMNPVNRALVKMVNQMVKTVDSVSLAAIASAVTATRAATAAWTLATARQMFLDVGLAKASILGLNQGYDPDTVVLDDTRWTYAMASFVDAGYLPRESASGAVQTGVFPVIEGMRWLRSPNMPTANTVLVLDSQQLGGMADEDLGGPGYVNSDGVGVQAKTMREDENDQYRVRCRRVTVPVVLEPGAACVVTGV